MTVAKRTLKLTLEAPGLEDTPRLQYGQHAVFSYMFFSDTEDLVVSHPNNYNTSVICPFLCLLNASLMLVTRQVLGIQR